MGIAEVIPGVSGSTLALVMGIYSRFITLLYQVSNFLKEIVLFFLFKSSYKNLVKRFKEIDMVFGIFLYFGRFLALILLSNIMYFLLEERREYILAFFFGLVLCSIAVPWGEIKKKGVKEVSLVFISAVVFFFILALKPYEFADLPHPLYFFFGGAVAICAMILPGISGSLVFLMLGLYKFIVEHVSSLTRLNFEIIEILNLFLVSLGIIFGFSIFVRFLKKGLENHSSTIYAILTGIVIASLRVLWPYSEVVELSEILVLTFVSSIGFGIVFFLRKLG